MTPYLIDANDLHKIISDSKQQMQRLSLPLFITGKEIEMCEVVNLARFESILMFLNSKGLLTRQVNFDYTDPRADFDWDLPEPKEEK